VSDIEIERCVLWPTRANVMRVAVRATREFSTRHVLMRDCDLIHNQRHIWYAPESLFCCITTDGKGGSVHQDYLFDNIRFEEPMALLGVNAPEAQFENFRFKQLHFLAGIPTGMLHAGVDGMRFEDVRAVDRLAQSASDLNLAIDGKVKNIQFSPSTSEPQKAHRDDKGGATP